MKNKNKGVVEDRILIDDLSSLAGESYQRLQTNIELANIDKKMKVIGITSATKSEGKSTTLANLANVYAQKHKKIIVLDLDLRRPSVHFYFKKPNEKGIVDYVLDECTKEELIKHSKTGVDFINCGKHTIFPSQIIESEKLGKLIKELRETYDYVLVDCPPILVGTDTVLATKFLDGIILTLRFNYVTKDMVNECIKQLRNTKVNIIGSVLTNLSPKDCGLYSYEEYKN